MQVTKPDPTKAARKPVHKQRRHRSSLASKEVSPKGPASCLRMLTYFINRGGKGLTDERRAELEKAKTFL